MKMELTIILAVASIGLFHGNAIAEGPYAFSVERFQVKGNLPVNAVDEFNDGDLLPWQHEDEGEGTAEESDGMVTITGPGNPCSGDGFQWNNFVICEEKSEIRLEGSGFAVADGKGNFWVKSTWERIVPAQNQGFGMNFDLERPLGTDFELITIGVLNVGPVVADILGVEEGLYVVFETDVGGLSENTQFARIYAEDITGNIILRLFFKDAGDRFFGRFSLDDGQNYHEFSETIHTRIGIGKAEFADWELYGRSLSFIEDTVALDIKPGSDPNGVNPRSKGVISVAVLGSVDFVAELVDVTTVKFGPLDATPVHDGHVEDVNNDGFADSVFHFRTQDTGISCGDTEATLIGDTFGGGVGPFTGTDSVKTAGCK